MNNTFKSTLVVMVCALFATTVTAQTRWDSPVDDDWDTPDAWDTDEAPGINDDAEHEDEASTITVTGDEQCNSFTGAPGSGRKLIIDAENRLHVVEDLVGSGGPSTQFIIEMASGAGFDDRTIVDVDGSVDNIRFTAPDSEHVEILVDEDVTLSYIALKTHFNVEIGGDLTAPSDSINLHTLDIRSMEMAGIATDSVVVTGDFRETLLAIYDIEQPNCTHGVPGVTVVS